MPEKRSVTRTFDRSQFSYCVNVRQTPVASSANCIYSRAMEKMTICKKGDVIQSDNEFTFSFEVQSVTDDWLKARIQMNASIRFAVSDVIGIADIEDIARNALLAVLDPV